MLAKIIISEDLSDRKSIFEGELKTQNLTLNHPDLLYIDQTEKMGVDQAKKIKQHFSYKPNQALGKMVIIENADNISLEAQNVLLKTIEELPALANFLMGASAESIFLPTVLSRCQVIKISFTQTLIAQTVVEEIDQLMALSMEKRFEYVEKLKDKEAFLLQLVQVFEKKLHSGQEDLSVLKPFLEQLLESEKWAAQNVNIRGILEYLMLIMPTINTK